MSDNNKKRDESNNKKNSKNNPFNPKTDIKKNEPKNKNINQSHQSTNFELRNVNNPYKNKPNKNNNFNIIDEERFKKREEEEKEKNKIRDKLQCYICYGKIINATMCSKCKALACEECVKKMLSKENICSNCKQVVLKTDMINLPFMNDLTYFFINNVETKKNQKNENKQNNLSNDIQINKNISEDIFNNIKCKLHNDSNEEYYCFNCNLNLCSKCLIVSNREVVDKHKDHIILSNEQIKEFNLKNIIKEYKEIAHLKLNLDNKTRKFKLLIEEKDIHKTMINDIINIIQSKLKGNYQREINSIKYKLGLLKNKKKEIDEHKKKFEEIMKKHDEDIEKNKDFFQKLKLLNYYPADKEDFIKSAFQKNISYESFESEIIEFKIPNNGEYFEGLQFFEKELNFIPNMPLKVTSNLLINNAVITIIIPIANDCYKKNTTFYGYLIFLNKESMYCKILNEFYQKNEFILSTEVEFMKIKDLLDENHKCGIKFNIIRNYYK